MKAEVEQALRNLGISTEGVKIILIDDNRVKVVKETVIGIYDFPRHTFVD